MASMVKYLAVEWLERFNDLQIVVNMRTSNMIASATIDENCSRDISAYTQIDIEAGKNIL